MFINKMLRRFILLTGLLFILPISLASAATINVTTTTDELTINSTCSLREALANTNHNLNFYPECGTRGTGTDTIYIPSGMYILTIPGTGEDTGATGDLDILDNTILVGDGKGLTIIDGDHRTIGDNVFHVKNTSAEFSSMTIQNGKAGLLTDNTTISLENTELINNVNYGIKALSTNNELYVSKNSEISYNRWKNIFAYGSQNDYKTLEMSDSSMFQNNHSASGIIANISGSVAITSSYFEKNSIHLENTSRSKNSYKLKNNHVLEGDTRIVNQNSFKDNIELNNNIFESAHLYGLKIEGLNGKMRNNEFKNGLVGLYVANFSNIQAEDILTENNGESGISVSESTFSCSNCEARNNLRSGIRAVYSSTLTLEDSTIEYNQSINSAGAGDIWYGGGVTVNSSTASIYNSTIENNHSYFEGGGIYAKDATLTIEDTTIKGNSTSGKGGGIYSDETTLLYSENNTLAYNMAYEGGGIYNEGNLHVNQNTISSNMALEGSGIYNNSQGSPTAIITSTTLYNNDILNTSGRLGFQASIVNYAVCSTAASGIIGSYGHNIDDTNTCSFNSTTDQINTNAQLGPLRDNGGPTYTHAISSSSPAIDKGVSCPTSTDQRGYNRFEDGNGDGAALCDVGAYEAIGQDGPENPNL